MIIKDEIAMNLVGNKNQVVFLAKVAEAGEFFFAVNATDWIVRTAQDEELGVWLDRGFHCIEVECPVVVCVEAKRSFDEFSICVIGCAKERRVDGGGSHHGLVCLRHRRGSRD